MNLMHLELLLVLSLFAFLLYLAQRGRAGRAREHEHAEAPEMAGSQSHVHVPGELPDESNALKREVGFGEFGYWPDEKEFIAPGKLHW